MRLFISTLLLACLFSEIKAQYVIDTIKCNDLVGYGPVVNGKKEHQWTYVYATYHSIAFSGEYSNDKKTGEWKDYSENAVFHYQNGVLHGPVTYYYNWGGPANQVYLKGQYKNGYADGEWDYYSNTAPVKITGKKFYANGVPTGSWCVSEGPYFMSGEMSAAGRIGHWSEKSGDSIIGGGDYVNGKKNGYWRMYDAGADYSEGSYAMDKKEGRWVEEFDRNPKEKQHTGWRFVTYYKNDLRDGPDSTWLGDELLEVRTYKAGKLNGMHRLFEEGKLTASGISITNPEYNYSPQNSPCAVAVPGIFRVDLLEQNICTSNICISDNEVLNLNIRDSLLRVLKAHPTVDRAQPATYAPEEVRTGHWIHYYANGNKKEEGDYLPKLLRVDIEWDSTNAVEDPNNPGIFINAPIKTEIPVYAKTGWWKIYNEKGELIREERYENGEVVETKLISR